MAALTNLPLSVKIALVMAILITTVLLTMTPSDVHAYIFFWRKSTVFIGVSENEAEMSDFEDWNPEFEPDQQNKSTSTSSPKKCLDKINQTMANWLPNKKSGKTTSKERPAPKRVSLEWLDKDIIEQLKLQYISESVEADRLIRLIGDSTEPATRLKKRQSKSAGPDIN